MSRPENAGAVGGQSTGIAEEDLYRIVRLAVEDAILGVLGTLLLVGVATVLTLTGVQLVVGATSTAWVAVGACLVLFGLYVGAATLGVVPSAREYLTSR
jgi:hypothetical protein